MGGRKAASELLAGMSVLRYSKARTIRKRGAVMWLLKLPFKLVAIVLMLVVGTIGVLLKIVSGISHVALGLIMFLLFVGGVITAFQGNWPLVGHGFCDGSDLFCRFAGRGDSGGSGGWNLWRIGGVYLLLKHTIKYRKSSRRVVCAIRSGAFCITGGLYPITIR